MKIVDVTLVPNILNVGQPFVLSVRVIFPDWANVKKDTWLNTRELTWGELCHKTERPWKRSGAFYCNEEYSF